VRGRDDCTRLLKELAHLLHKTLMVPRANLHASTNHGGVLICAFRAELLRMPASGGQGGWS